MYLQIITFRLDGMTPDEFAQLCDHVAPQYAGTSGFVSKIFLADPDDDHAYGGVYLWESRADAERYVRDGLAQVLVSDPRFTDLDIRLFEVNAGPTALTGGPFAGVAAGVAS